MIASSRGIGCHDFTHMVVRRARRRPDDNLDSTGDSLPLSLAVAAMVRVFRPIGRCGNKPGGPADVPWALAVWFGLLLITILRWFSLRPKSDRDWARDGSAAPCRNGGRRVRAPIPQLSYTAAGEPLPRYEERTYDLTELSSLDYFLSHWSGPVMAHTLVSFGFDDGQFLRCRSKHAANVGNRIRRCGVCFDHTR